MLVTNLTANIIKIEKFQYEFNIKKKMMFNERFKLQDKDSLDEESISATNMNVNPFGDQFSNENNYDFLYDEEYQKMRLEKDNF